MFFLSSCYRACFDTHRVSYWTTKNSRSVDLSIILSVPYDWSVPSCLDKTDSQFFYATLSRAGKFWITRTLSLFCAGTSSFIIVPYNLYRLLLCMQHFYFCILYFRIESFCSFTSEPISCSTTFSALYTYTHTRIISVLVKLSTKHKQ